MQSPAAPPHGGVRWSVGVLRRLHVRRLHCGEELMTAENTWTYEGWWCWQCDGLGGPDDEPCPCCGGGGEHDQVLPPPCAPPAAWTGLDRRWWGAGAAAEKS